MSHKDDVREFLTSRRAKVTPEQVGLPTFGDKRRVAGLRREEVALLAGVSADYYIRLERGNLAGVSEQVLDSLAKALRLDDAERAHLFDLARASTGPVRGSRRTTVSKVRPGVLRLLEALATPAYVRNARTDILAVNDLALVLYDGILDRERLPMNLARLLFLDHRAPEFFLDWETVADDSVAALRAEAGRNPHDKSLTDLVGELATRSDEFRTRWARHNVKYHRTAAKRLHNSLVGDLELTGEAMELPGDGLVIITYTAEPDSPAAESLRFLSSWATQHSEA
ncbi:helix-turn-helix transcriptional regulator [Kribbella sp. NBC_00662]|uniref:helix-turn-helix transcriptional regulator n=1 Tax=Kribbella sp. NBC_00662 TaxID=2975969 RepID=UPI00324E46B5